MLCFFFRIAQKLRNQRLIFFVVLAARSLGDYDGRPFAPEREGANITVWRLAG